MAKRFPNTGYPSLVFIRYKPMDIKTLNRYEMKVLMLLQEHRYMSGTDILKALKSLNRGKVYAALRSLVSHRMVSVITKEIPFKQSAGYMLESKGNLFLMGNRKKLKNNHLCVTYIDLSHLKPCTPMY